jgi:cytochrome P450
MDNTWASARSRVDARRAKGDKRNCIIDRILDGEKALDVPLTDKQLNHFLGVLVEGGADTTSSSILVSILQLVQFPEFQKKAQKELDAVCGTER